MEKKSNKTVEKKIGLTILTRNTMQTLYSFREASNFSKEMNSNTSTTNPKEKIPPKNRASAKDEEIIIHPFFLEMSELCDDLFWKASLERASKGKFVKGVQYKNGVIYFRNKNKLVQGDIDIVNIEQGLKDFLYFMNEEKNISSADDLKKKEIELKERLENLTVVNITSWDHVKKDMTKKILVNKYIEKFSNDLILDGEQALTDNQKQDMDNKIFIGINTGYFNSESIIMKDGFIYKINGLIFKNRTFDIDLNNQRSKPSKRKGRTEPEEEISTALTCTTKNASVYGGSKNANPEFIKLWIKCLKNFNKHKSKYRKKTDS